MGDSIKTRGAHRRPTIAVLQQMFRVTDEGLLVRLIDSGTNGKAGAAAGNINAGGYLQLEVCGFPTTAHRVVFAIVFGRWPNGEIDHIDGNKINNRPSNLREASRKVNAQNIRKAKKSNNLGFLGVSPGRRGKFRASLRVDGKQRYLGEFDTPEKAHAAYLTEKRKHHPGGTI